MADQVLYSATNFALTASVAHFSGSRQFGAYAVIYATFLIFNGINRGVAAEPLIILYSASSPGVQRSATARSIRASMFVAVVLGGLLCCGALLAPPDFRPVMLVFAGALPLVFMQDLLRYAAFARGRPSSALASDLAVLAVQAGLTVLLVVRRSHSAPLLVAAWAVAAATGMIVGLVQMRRVPKPADSVPTTSQRRRLALRLGLDNAVVGVSQQATGYVLAGVVGLAAAGGLRAAQTAYAPATTLALGVQSAVIPELVRLRARSLSSMVRALKFVGVGLAVLAAVFLVGLPLVPDQVGKAVFGTSWSDAGTLLPFIGLAQLAAVPAGMSQAGLRTLGEGNRTLRARIIGVAWFAGIAIPCAVFGREIGAGIGLAIGSAGQSLVWLGFFRRAYRDHVDASAPA